MYKNYLEWKSMNFYVEGPTKFPATWHTIMKPQDTRDNEITVLVFQ